MDRICAVPHDEGRGTAENTGNAAFFAWPSAGNELLAAVLQFQAACHPAWSDGDIDPCIRRDICGGRFETEDVK